MHTLISSSKSFLQQTETINSFNKQQSSFFSSTDWYQNFIDTVVKKDGDGCLFIHIKKEGEKLGSVFPISVFKNTKKQITIKSLSNYYSPIYDFISKEIDSSDLDCFFEELSGLNWDTMELKPLSFESTFSIRSLLNTLKISSIPFFCFGNWYLPVNNQSFDEYFSTLSSKVKNTVKRKTKKFNNLQDSSVEILLTLDDVDKAIQAFEAVYSSSWKIPEPYPDFIPGLMKISAKQGALRVGIAYIEGKPIASQLWIVADNSAYIFKLAYDEAYKQYSAGTVLTAKMMQHVIDCDKVEVVDYLCGDDNYKKDWMSHRRERWGLLIFNTSNLRGLFKFCKEMPKFWLKEILSLLRRQ